MSTCVHRILLRTLIRQAPACGSVRLYGRWMHRSPAKVLLPLEPNSKSNLKKEKIIDLDPAILNKGQNQVKQKDILKVETDDKRESTQSTESSLPREKAKEIKQKKDERLKKLKFYLSQQKVFDDNGDIIYEKLKENDARIRSVICT